MQISGMRIKQTDLTLDRFNHRRVCVPDVGHIVVHIQIAPSGRIKKPRALPAHQVQRLLIKQLGASAEKLPAAQS